MDRRRLAMLLAGVVAVALAVLVLRQTQEAAPDRNDGAPTSFKPAPTTVEQLAERGVVLPEPGKPPTDVGTVQVSAGDRMVRLRWGPAVSGQTPAGATGYEVAWGPDGNLDRRMLVAAPELELRGLANGTRYDVDVRSIDAFGQRSGAIRASATPAPGEPDPWQQAFTGLYDDFRTGPAPDPARWAVQRIGNKCLRAGRGAGEEDGRLVLELQCGSTAAVLRARIPLRLADGPVLGRIGLVTDGPIPGGQVSIALVPGPVATLGVPPDANIHPAAPGLVPEDPNLPPGTIRTVIDARNAVITTGRGVSRTPEPLAAPQLKTVLGSPGVTSRWDLELATTGVTLRRDNELAAAAGVLPGWREATVLFEFTAPPGEVTRLHIDAMGFSGASGTPPNVVDVPDAVAGRQVLLPQHPDPHTDLLPAAPNARSARLLAIVGPSRDCAPPDLLADFGGPTIQLNPAIPGGVPPDGPYCPLVGELTASLLDLLSQGKLGQPFLRSGDGGNLPVAGSNLEISLPDGVAAERKPVVSEPGQPPTGDRHRLPQLSAELRDAAGKELVPGEPVERGRLVLEIALDGLAGQRTTGQVGGVAGLQVLVDNKLSAGLPTARDGPGVGGSYRFGLAVNKLEAGSHVIEVRVLGTQTGTRPRSVWVSFQLR